MYKGLKSNKLKSKQLLPKSISNHNHSYGIGTLPSDSMNKIMTHEFEQEYLKNKQDRFDEEKEKLLLLKKLKRGQHTKASKIRLEYQQ
jgi:hypothetical protein